MAAIILTKRELSPAQYAAKYGNGMSESTVKRRCEDGHIKAFKVGNRWKIPDDEGDVISRELYDAIKCENAELRAILSSINKLTQTI